MQRRALGAHGPVPLMFSAMFFVHAYLHKYKVICKGSWRDRFSSRSRSLILKHGLVTVSLCVALSGCAAVWGRAYKVEFLNSSRVVINYDPALTDVGSLLNVAQRKCQLYGKDAEPVQILPAELGLEHFLT